MTCTMEERLFPCMIDTKNSGSRKNKMREVLRTGISVALDDASVGIERGFSVSFFNEVRRSINWKVGSAQETDFRNW